MSSPAWESTWPRPRIAPISSPATRVVQHACSDSRDLGHSYVGTGHLVLGLLLDEKGSGGRVLADPEVHLEQARAETRRWCC